MKQSDLSKGMRNAEHLSELARMGRDLRGVGDDAWEMEYENASKVGDCKGGGDR